MWKMSVMLKPTALLPKNVAVSDFESMRKEHNHKQINFLMIQVTNGLETKFDIEVQEHNYQDRWPEKSSIVLFKIFCKRKWRLFKHNSKLPIFLINCLLLKEKLGLN